MSYDIASRLLPDSTRRAMQAGTGSVRQIINPTTLAQRFGAYSWRPPTSQTPAPESGEGNWLQNAASTAWNVAPLLTGSPVGLITRMAAQTAGEALTESAFKSPYTTEMRQALGARLGGQMGQVGTQAGATLDGGAASADRKFFQSPGLSTLDDFAARLREQEEELRRAREQAASLDAYLATASYDADLAVIQRKIAEVETMRGNLGAAWDKWEQDAMSAIATTADQTRAAYAEYISLINQGFEAYDAAVRSGYLAYQDQVRTQIQGFLDTTNQSYGDFAAKLPAIWQPVVTAAAEGDQAALAAIHANQQEAASSIQGQIVSGTQHFADEMARIGAANPALATELLTDLHEIGGLALDLSTTTAEGGRDVQGAVGRVAATAAQFALASAMRQNEEARLTLINDTARQRHQILTASSHDLAQREMDSAVARQQGLLDTQASLDQALAELDRDALELRDYAKESEATMRYELSQALQDLLDRSFTTSVDRGAAAIRARAANQGEITKAQQIEFAGGYMMQRIAEYAERYEHLTPLRIESIANTVTGWFQQGTIDTAEEFNDYIKQMTAQRDQGLISAEEYAAQVPPPEDWGVYRAAILAMREGLADYESTYGSVADGQAQYTMPIAQYSRVADLWGMRPDYDTPDPHDREMHHGVDIMAPKGTPLYATRGGVLRYYRNDAAGDALYIDHGDGTRSRYAHMDGYGMSPPDGSTVRAGDVIGSVGDTGNANAPHLHFSFMVDGEYVDPVAWGVLNFG